MKHALVTASLIAASCGPSPAPVNPGPAPAPAAQPVAPAAPAVDVADLYREWVDLGNKGAWPELAARFAADATAHPASSGMTLVGPANIQTFFQSFAHGFPDLVTHPLLVFTGERKLAAVALSRGTNTADMGPTKATGRQTSFVGLTTMTFDDAGAIRELVVYADNLNFMGQLGAWKGDARAVDAREPGPPAVIATGTGADEAANLLTVARWNDRFNAHDAPGLLQLYAPAAILDDTHLAGPIATATAIGTWYSNLFPGFPDIVARVTDAWAAGDYVIVTYALQGTNGGAYPRLGATRTMRQIELEAAAVFLIRGGLIAEHHVFVDGMAMGYQLGVLGF